MICPICGTDTDTIDEMKQVNREAAQGRDVVCKFLGMDVVINPTIPPDQVQIRDKDERILGVITNLAPAAAPDAMPEPYVIYLTVEDCKRIGQEGHHGEWVPRSYASRLRAKLEAEEKDVATTALAEMNRHIEALESKGAGAYHSLVTARVDRSNLIDRIAARRGEEGEQK